MTEDMNDGIACRVIVDKDKTLFVEIDALLSWLKLHQSKETDETAVELYHNIIKGIIQMRNRKQ